MIARMWKGHATRENAPAYFAHLTGNVLPALREIRGFKGARVLRRVSGPEVEFVVLTHWDSWEAIRAFAGADPEKAVVEPAARAVLAQYDDFVRHFEVAHES